MRIFRLSTRFPTELPPALNPSISTAATYQNAAGLTRRLAKYVNEVSEFVGDSWGNNVVRFSDIKGRALNLAVPKGSVTATQKAVIENVRQWARTLNSPVDIIVNEF
jgi:hypothetical protein